MLDGMMIRRENTLYKRGYLVVVRVVLLDKREIHWSIFPHTLL